MCTPSCAFNDPLYLHTVIWDNPQSLQILDPGKHLWAFFPRMMRHCGLCLFDQHYRTFDLQSDKHMMHKPGLLRGFYAPRLITMAYEAPLHNDIMVSQIGSSYQNLPGMDKFLHESPPIKWAAW